MLKKCREFISFTLILAFILSSLYLPQAMAGEMVMPFMPQPGSMVDLSPQYTPAFLKGLIIHKDNALKFDFLVNKGEGGLDQDEKFIEYNKLIKYFLAALTVPEEDQWVNLSPYEKERIIDTDFGRTQMGHDLLGQDYLLKQLTSSLMYPDSDLGKSFWTEIYARAYKQFGTTDIPVNTFNKVWIVPDSALIYENGNIAYIVRSHLKVMLEEDYVSLKAHTAIDHPDTKQNPVLHAVSSQVIKDVILPALEKEVNEGKNFAMLRQVYSGMLLATWYKKALRASILGRVYADKDKVSGVDQDPANNEKIYQQYIAAFKKGVYNFIQEDEDRYTNQIIPRKYFAGGFQPDFSRTAMAQVSVRQINEAITDYGGQNTLDKAMVQVDPAAMAPTAINPTPLIKNVLGVDQIVATPVNKESGRVYSSITLNRVLTTQEKDGLQRLVSRLPSVNLGPLEEKMNQDTGRMQTTIAFDYPDRALLAVPELSTGRFYRVLLTNEGVGLAQSEGWALKTDVSGAPYVDGRPGAEQNKDGRIINFNFVKGVNEQGQRILAPFGINRKTEILDIVPEPDTVTYPIRQGGYDMLPQAPNRDEINPGGIDMNSANLDLLIKRNGNGVPLPLARQDMAQLSQIPGFAPHILEIKPFDGITTVTETSSY